MRETMFRRFPDGSAVGDVIPVYDLAAELFHLFILAAPAGSVHYPDRLKTPWRHLASHDLVNWEERPNALTPGEPGSIDSEGIWTGSIIITEGRWHAFYTGVAVGAHQTVCRATSEDGDVWIKAVDNPVSSPPAVDFDQLAWRDPFVDVGGPGFRMLVTARTAAGQGQGVLVEQTSRDLTHWSEPQVVHAPFLVHAPECPERFTIDDVPILAFSTYTNSPGTVYQSSAADAGPWTGALAGPDGPYFYAAKGLTDASGRRLVFGWIPDRDPSPANLANPWLWGGDLALPRELHLGPGRRISTRPARELHDVVGRDVDTTMRGSIDLLCLNEVDACLHEVVGLLEASVPPQDYLVEVAFSAATSATAVGIVVSSGVDGTGGLGIFLDSSSRKASMIDMSGSTVFSNTEFAGLFGAFSPVVERQMHVESPLELTVFVRGDLVEAFAGHDCCLTYRLVSSTPAQNVQVVVAGGMGRLQKINWKVLQL